MLRNILEFGKLRVDDVMVPRADIVSVDHTSDIATLLEVFREAGHSRLPVYRGSLDDPAGMVHIKDLVAWLTEPRNGEAKNRRTKSNGAKQSKAGKDNGRTSKVRLSGTDLSCKLSDLSIIRDVLFVPPSMPVGDLLVKMQSSRNHLAIVVDEYGGTDGLVSIEDLVEEIVGEIEDEHDIEGGEMIVPDGAGRFTADARAPIADLEQLLEQDLVDEDRDEDVDTLGGLVFSLAGRVPVRGELIRHHSGIEFEVLDTDTRRIRRLRVHARRKAARLARAESAGAAAEKP